MLLINILEGKSKGEKINAHPFHPQNDFFTIFLGASMIKKESLGSVSSMTIIIIGNMNQLDLLSGVFRT